MLTALFPHFQMIIYRWCLAIWESYKLCHQLHLHNSLGLKLKAITTCMSNENLSVTHSLHPPPKLVLFALSFQQLQAKRTNWKLELISNKSKSNWINDILPIFKQWILITNPGFICNFTLCISLLGKLQLYGNSVLVLFIFRMVCDFYGISICVFSFFSDWFI